MSIQASDAAIIKGLLAQGRKQHDIAATFGVNAGRIAEIATGKAHADVAPAAVPAFIPLTFNIIDFMTKRAEQVEHPIAEPVSVNHELAALILEHRNGSNRPKKPVKIKEYAEDMAAGAWELNGTSLKFDQNGELVDGQNRLRAQMSARVPFDTMAVFGVPRRFFVTVDQGKPRTAADLLHIEGCVNAAKVASALRWIMILAGDTPEDRGITYPPGEILEAWRKLDKEGRDLLAEAVSAASAIYTQYGHSVSQLAGTYYTLAKADHARTKLLYDLWKKDHARISGLQAFLAQYKENSTLKRLPEQVLIGSVIKAWNRVENRKIKLRRADVAMNPQDRFEPWS